jgi:hypothetical protein
MAGAERLPYEEIRRLTESRYPSAAGPRHRAARCTDAWAHPPLITIDEFAAAN